MSAVWAVEDAVREVLAKGNDVELVAAFSGIDPDRLRVEVERIRRRPPRPRPSGNGMVSPRPIRSAPEQQQAAEDTSSRKPRPIDWAAFWENAPDDTEWALEPLIRRGEVVSLVAAAGTGKSLLALEAAAAKATGGTFLDCRLQRGHVVYVDQENPAHAIQDRLSDLGYDKDSDLSWLHYYTFQPFDPFDTPAGANQLADAAAGHGAELVFLDSSQRVIAGKENDSDTYRAFDRCTVRRMRAARVGLLLLDNIGKDAERGARGSSAKRDLLDYEWTLTDHGNKRLWLRCSKSRGVATADHLSLLRLEMPLRHGLSTVNDADDAVSALIETLDAFLLPDTATRRECADALKQAGMRYTVAKLQEAVNRRKTRQG